MGSFGERVAAVGFLPLFGDQADQADGPPLWPPPPRQATADGQGEAEAGDVRGRGRGRMRDERERQRDWREAGVVGPGADAQGSFQVVHMVHPQGPELARSMDVGSSSLRGDNNMHPMHHHPHYVAGAPADGTLPPPTAEVPAYTSAVTAAFQNLQDTAPLTTRYFAPHNQPPPPLQQHAPDGLQHPGAPRPPEGGGHMLVVHPGLPPDGSGQGPLRGDFIPLVQASNVLAAPPGHQPAHAHAHGAPMGLPHWGPNGPEGAVLGERRVLVEPGHPLFMPGERRVLVEHPSFAPGERRLVIEAGPGPPPGAWVEGAEQPFPGEQQRRAVVVEHMGQEHRHVVHFREPMPAPGQGYEPREGRWGRQEYGHQREREEFRGSWAAEREHRGHGRGSGLERDGRQLSRTVVGRRGSERHRADGERDEGGLRSRGGRNGRGKEEDEGNKKEESRRKRNRVEESKDSEATKDVPKVKDKKPAAGTDKTKMDKDAGDTSEDKKGGAGGDKDKEEAKGKDSIPAATGTKEGDKEVAKVEAVKQTTQTANGKQQNGEAPAEQEKSKSPASKAGAADATTSKSAGKPSGVAARLSRAIPGYIFGCTKRTRDECYQRKLFGSQQGHLKDVERISDGTPLFLFNFDSKILEGGFVADGPGGKDFVPDAWTGSTRMRFPAQVRFSLKEPLPGLTEAEFKPAICENFFSGAKFHMLLSEPQVNRLLDLFHAKAKTQAEADKAKKPNESPGSGKKKKVKWDDGKKS